MRFTVRYEVGPYNGAMIVNAVDSEDAIAIVRTQIRKDVTITMYSESYRVVCIEDNWDLDKEW